MKRSPRLVGARGPRGSQTPGGAEGAPYLIVDEGGKEAPQGGSFPAGPQGGEEPSGGEPGAPVGSKAPTEPRPETEAEVSARAPKARDFVWSAATPGATAGAHVTAPGS